MNDDISMSSVDSFISNDDSYDYNDNNDCNNSIQLLSTSSSNVNENNNNSNNNIIIEPRDVALRKLMKDPVNNWKLLPNIYKNDIEFVLHVLNNATKLPSKSDFERQFQQSLRFNRDVVIAFCNRIDFNTLYYDRHLFVPGCLMNDKDVMIAYCNKIPRSLQECSEILIDDIDVVMAAIQLDGLELQYASRRLQENEQLIRIACQKDGRALDFCPDGPIKQKLLADRDFMLQVLRHNGGPLLRLVSNELQNDRELLLTAVQHGMLLRYCPKYIQNDKEFITDAVSRKSSIYLDLRTNLQSQQNIAIAAILASDTTSTIIDKSLSYIHDIIMSTTDINIIYAIVKNSDISFMKTFILDPRRQYILSNYDVMLLAIQRDCDIYTYCNITLRTNINIIMAAITEESSIRILRSLVPANININNANNNNNNNNRIIINQNNNNFLVQHPEICIKAISVTNKRNLRILQTIIPDILWCNNIDIQSIWIRCGGKILQPQFDNTLENNEQFGILIAKYNWYEFYKVGINLRCNINFMKLAILQNGKVFRYCGNETLCNNIELAILAISNNAYALNNINTNINNNTNIIRITKQNVQNHVQNQLLLYNIYIKEFLCGISLSPTSSPLSMLHCDIETSTALKKHIANFLGIPIGETLTLYKKCLQNILHPPPPSSNDNNDHNNNDFDNHHHPAVLAEHHHHRHRHRLHQMAAARRAERAAVFMFGLDDDDDDNDIFDDVFLLGGADENNNNIRGAAAAAAAPLEVNNNNNNFAFLRPWNNNNNNEDNNNVDDAAAANNRNNNNVAAANNNNNVAAANNNNNGPGFVRLGFDEQRLGPRGGGIRWGIAAAAARQRRAGGGGGDDDNNNHMDVERALRDRRRAFLRMRINRGEQQQQQQNHNNNDDNDDNDHHRGGRFGWLF